MPSSVADRRSWRKAFVRYIFCLHSEVTSLPSLTSRTLSAVHKITTVSEYGGLGYRECCELLGEIRRRHGTTATLKPDKYETITRPSMKTYLYPRILQQSNKRRVKPILGISQIDKCAREKKILCSFICQLHPPRMGCSSPGLSSHRLGCCL